MVSGSSNARETRHRLGRPDVRAAYLKEILEEIKDAFSLAPPESKTPPENIPSLIASGAPTPQSAWPNPPHV